MTNLLEIKPYVHDFVEDNLDRAFANKVYWMGERKNVPEYPYCMLSVIAENKDRRTSHHNGDLVEVVESGQSNVQILREKITTRYKTCTVTVGVYNAWVEDTCDTRDMDTEKEFAYEQIDFLEGAFENYPTNNIFSIQAISPIRPLHEVVDGGYMYRFEFDLTIGYDELQTTMGELAEEVETDINKTYDHNSSGADNTIYFKIDSQGNMILGEIINK